MTREELAEMVRLVMCSDPWPVKYLNGDEDRNNRRVVIDMADNAARTWGFADWVDAYHKLGG